MPALFATCRSRAITGTGAIYIAGMDEGGGGFPHNDTNKIFRSTDGGNTWTNTYTGSPFPGPGVTAVGYFAQMFTDLAAYWRHEGWGEPAAINNFVTWSIPSTAPALTPVTSITSAPPTAA